MDSGGKSHFCVRRVGGKADLVIFLNDFLLTVFLFFSLPTFFAARGSAHHLLR